MTLLRQWREIRTSLPEDWGDARLLLRVDDEGRAERASALLAPLMSGRSGPEVRFTCARVGGPGEDALRRLLGRLERERIGGRLELVSATSTSEQGHATTPARTDAAAPATGRPTWRAEPLAPDWDAELAGLPDDWSDIYAEVELDSSDHLERGALLLGPVNPARDGERLAFRFRCARRFGYGAPAAMVRRCLERLDGEGITGRLRILRALSDTQPVDTQGPVWYVGGRAV
ncbi:MAG: hypothetical protein ICV59_07825 [Thermoleophilia bacterium]|nr:hypothetical protein [Thermoleophilia bacterium]